MNRQSLMRMIGETNVGSTVTVVVVRNGQERDFEVVLEERTIGIR